jgi:hypothetical protein
MLHEHMFDGTAEIITIPQPFTSPRLYLAFGVTTIRTAGTDHPYVDLNVKRGIDRGTVPGPEMHLTGPFLNGEGGRFLTEKIVRDPEDGRRAVRYWAAEGFTSFKVYQQISKDALAAIIDEAHRLGLRGRVRREADTGLSGPPDQAPFPIGLAPAWCRGATARIASRRRDLIATRVTLDTDWRGRQC